MLLDLLGDLLWDYCYYYYNPDLSASEIVLVLLIVIAYLVFIACIYEGLLRYDPIVVVIFVFPSTNPSIVLELWLPLLYG